MICFLQVCFSLVGCVGHVLWEHVYIVYTYTPHDIFSLQRVSGYIAFISSYDCGQRRNWDGKRARGGFLTIKVRLNGMRRGASQVMMSSTSLIDQRLCSQGAWKAGWLNLVYSSIKMISVYMRICLLVCVCLCAYLCLHVCVYVRTCVFVCACVCVEYVRACYSVFLIIIAVDLEVKPQISLSNENGDVLSPVLEMAKSNRTSM